MLTKQEMMDRAVEGLASQGFRKCADKDGQCMYTYESDGQVMHCAWGWVDTSLSCNVGETVTGLRVKGIGLAASLNVESLGFARQLQNAHDLAVDAGNMKGRLLRLCQAFGLRIPLALTNTESVQ